MTDTRRFCDSSGQHRPLRLLYELSSDREQVTDEIYAPNDFYGNASALKSYLNKPPSYAVKAAMEHSAELGQGNWMLNVQAPLPAVISMSPSRHAFIRPHTNKSLYAVGPYVHYAPHALSEEELHYERKRLGRNLLAFPAHSTHYVTCDHSVDKFSMLLRELGKEFDSVRVCVYWKDVLDGTADEYARRGFECVTCGHMFDHMFLPRLKSLIAISSMTVSNALTTALGYSVFMGIPHYYHPSVVGYGCQDEETFKIMLGESHYREASSDIREIEEVFSEFSQEVTPRQYETADRYWGLSSTLDKDGLAALFQELEAMYRVRDGQ